jgi:hypothetical protein
LFKNENTCIQRSEKLKNIRSRKMSPPKTLVSNAVASKMSHGSSTNLPDPTIHITEAGQNV